jgi:uncharacterized membrane protein
MMLDDRFHGDTAMKSAGTGKWMLGGAALGAAIMYAFDPERGRSRRAVARDKATRAVNRMRSTLDTARRDFGNRLTGLRAEASRVMGRAETGEERALIARVRAQLGRCVSNPHAIKVRAVEGCVFLSGPVLASEESRVKTEIARIPGVSDVVSRLDIHAQPGSIPSLQGSRSRRTKRRYWGPAKRIAAGTAGSALVLSGLSMRSSFGLLLSLAGAGLAARAVSNRELGQLLGVAGKGGIDVEKAIEIKASPERIFEVWERYENFPHFMSHIKRVQDLGDGRSHWIVEGPAGSTVEFDARLIRHERPHLLAWRTDPGSEVEHEGMVRIDPTPGGSRVTVRMSYNPPGGALGHAVTALFGTDPKRQMDDDLMRMRAFIETGVPPRDAAIAPAGVRPDVRATPSLRT